MQALRRCLLFVLFFFLYFAGYGQLPCGFGDLSVEEEKIAQQLIKQYQSHKNFRIDGATPTYIAVKPHFISTSAGVTNMTMAAFNNAIAICNQYFGNAGIQFYICGTPANTPNYIYSTAMYNWETTGFNRDSVTNANNVNNAHNIYFSNSLGGVGGFSFGATQNKVNNRSFILNGQADDNKTLAHELGHYFNLAHTFNNSASSVINDRERVTRNPSEIAPRLSANCSTTGDYVCDTPADPYNLSGGTLSSCNSTGEGITVVDVNGDHFVPSTYNVMNYYFCEPYDFSPLQYARMNAALAINNTPNPNPANRYTLDCAETPQSAPSNVVATLLSTSVSLGVQIQWADNSNNETGYIIERSSSPTDGFIAIAGVDANITSFNDLRVSEQQTYYYRVKASNTKNNYNSSIPSITTPAYCGPKYSSGCLTNANITNFKVMTQSGTTVLTNQGSGCSSNNFGDFTSLSSLHVKAGTTYNFSMNTGYSGGYYPEHLGIWLDANQNNSFSDLGEQVYQSTGSIMNGTTLITGSFTLPTTTKAGPIRLRVRSRMAYEGVVDSPCGLFNYGETEDYLLQIDSSINITTVIPTLCPNNNILTIKLVKNFTPNSNNVFSAELSDATGNFSNPIVVGTSANDSIQISIPANTLAGTSYKLRIKASSPAITGNETATFGYGSATASLSLIGRDVVTTGTSSSLRVTFTGASPYSLRLSDGTSFSNLVSTSKDITINPTSTTTYQLDNASGGCGLASVSGTATVRVIPYCLPLYSSNCSSTVTTAKMAINQVTLKKANGQVLMDNDNSNCSTFSFSDYTNTTLPISTLKGDSTYSVFAKGYYGTDGYYPQYFTVWIDYNQNNSFADAGELVWQSPSAGYSTTGSFTIPSTATIGTTRMRVRSRYGSAATDPCTSISSGEAEDYTVQISRIVSVGGTLTGGGVTVCPNTEINTVFNLSGQTGSILKWQSANDSTFANPNDIASTASSYTVNSVSSSMYFRAVVQNGLAPIAYSTVGKILVSSITSTQSGNWEDASTWNLNRLPQSGDFVTIRSSDTVFITSDTAQAKCIYQENNSSLIFTTVSGKLTLEK